MKQPAKGDKKCLERLLSKGLQAYLSLEGEKMLPADKKEANAVVDGLLKAAADSPKSIYSVYAASSLVKMMDWREMDSERREKIMHCAREVMDKNPHPRVLYFYSRRLYLNAAVAARRYLAAAGKMEPDLAVSRKAQTLKGEMGSVMTREKVRF